MSMMMMMLVLCCDSKDDLVVGAPFYFEPGVGGAIYVYLSGPQVCQHESRHGAIRYEMLVSRALII